MSPARRRLLATWPLLLALLILLSAPASFGQGLGQTTTKAGPAAAASVEPITLEDVRRSVERHFPLLQAVLLEREARIEAERRALGAFDLGLSASGQLDAVGFYERSTADALLEQQTPFWGARFLAGYRYGRGDFPSYFGGDLTDSNGEMRLGAEIPLLRGGAIDKGRAELRRARIGLESVTPEIRLERVAILRDASVAFWHWLAAGRAVEIARSLVEVAEARQDQIAGRVKRGGEPEIDLVDNQRLVVERQVVLRGAERELAQTAIRLSLYLRDEQGNPVLPDPDRRPVIFPPEVLPTPEAIEADLELARRAHPILQQFAFQREQLEVDLQLAENDTLPSIDLTVEGARDFGNSRPGIDERGKLSEDPRSSTEITAGLRFALPIQRREARGRLGVARIRLAQLERRERFAREQVLADARLALEALQAAYDQTGQARENLRLAERLQKAEERKLELGLSNLIDVNIREVQAATAARQLVGAQEAYFRALAEYEARIARPPTAGTRALSAVEIEPGLRLVEE